MNKLQITALGAGVGSLVGLGLLAGLGASPGLAQSVNPAASATTTTAVSAPPIQGAKKNIVIYVDTVTGGGSPKPAGTCLQENQFVQGQLVVFRMYATDITSGGYALTDRNTKAAYVTVPGKGKLPLVYRSEDNAPAYWEVPWSTVGYPVGQVNFTVTVVAKPLAQWGVAALAKSKVRAQGSVYHQPFNSTSDLTIVAAPPASTTTTTSAS